MRDRGSTTGRGIGGRVADSGSQITHPSVTPPHPAVTAIRLYSPSLSLSLFLSLNVTCVHGIYGCNAGVVTLSKHSRVVCGVMCCTVASAFALFFSGMRESRKETQRTTLMSIVIECDFVTMFFFFLSFSSQEPCNFGCINRALCLRDRLLVGI